MKDSLLATFSFAEKDYIVEYLYPEIAKAFMHLIAEAKRLGAIPERPEPAGTDQQTPERHTQSTQTDLLTETAAPSPPDSEPLIKTPKRSYRPSSAFAKPILTKSVNARQSNLSDIQHKRRPAKGL